MQMMLKAARFAPRLLALAAPVLLGSAMPCFAGSAAAQGITINRSGGEDLSAINSGDVSLRGDVTNPTVSGGINNSAGTLTAQGASTSYGITDTNLNAQGEGVGTYTASVSDTRSSGINSGSVNVRATITGGSFAGSNNSQSVSATGLSNIISIRTTSK